ncbi:GNAT family N-acetyltransferase [Sphingomonas sp.]|uniref:GNAT family N-acetyltransferase n=1 Tax=Sphingomonas sp. TaxID=28214 RepID=UPI002CB4EB45|nr:GNAT family N-acetyltransferase [Sphingomonas sp.]HTG37236.1 GNAT family N-acetyltransferase [Sphingomonas sp.]
MIEPVATPGPDDRDAILLILAAHNASAAPPIDARDIAFYATGDDGRRVGGLWGRIAYRWLFVQYLALEPMARGNGLGTGLMRAAVDEAMAAGCVGVWLDTFSFQARGFYERLGFTVFGQIDDYPPGDTRFFMVRRFG